MIKVLTVFGTRPEAIKMAPLVAELGRFPDIIDNRTCLTGQHRDMVAPIIELFGLRVDHDLDVMRPNQSLDYLTGRMLEEVSAILRAEHYDYLLVQGDTTTSMAAAMAAFYNGVRIGHVEAGLRTFDKYHPYPEEANRRIIDAMADLYFAHTESARANLLAEGVDASRVAVTGNTVIDALLDVSTRPFDLASSVLAGLPFDTRRVILVTAHRRESFGGPFESMCRGIRELALRYRGEAHFVYPVHRNPNVLEVTGRILDGLDNVQLIDPLDYVPFVQLLKRCHLVLTDSGGLQEEAPGLGKPVLVMRKVTERPEGVEAGTVRLVGTATRDIVDAVARLLDDPEAHAAMAARVNPYGDGTAARRTVARLLADAGLDARAPDGARVAV